MAHDPLKELDGTFGLRRYGRTKNDHGMTLGAADRRLRAHLRRLIRYDLEHVLVNRDVYLIPGDRVGCVAHLVDRAAGDVRSWDDHTSVQTHLWAYYRGFAEGPTRAARLNDLEITSVRDPRRVRAVLRRFRGGRDAPSQLPKVLRSVDLYFARTELRLAEIQGWFDFVVRPPS